MLTSSFEPIYSGSWMTRISFGLHTAIRCYGIEFYSEDDRRIDIMGDTVLDESLYDGRGDMCFHSSL